MLSIVLQHVLVFTERRFTAAVYISVLILSIETIDKKIFLKTFFDDIRSFFRLCVTDVKVRISRFKGVQGFIGGGSEIRYVPQLYDLTFDLEEIAE